MNFPNINSEAALKMRDDYKKRFEGKIACNHCDNNDWEQFFYIQVGEEIAAGCKKCGGGNFFSIRKAACA